MSKWKGRRRAFAEALVAAKPERISNRRLAELAGCPAATAASAGARLAGDPMVQDYVRRHWPDYYGRAATPPDADPAAAAAPVITPQAAALPASRPAAFSMPAVKAWLAELPTDSPVFEELVQAVCLKLGASRNPLDYWDSVLLNPYAPAKEKAQAAADKARYTMAKPASQSAKDTALEKMVQRRGQQQSLFGQDDDADNANGHNYRSKVPQWVN